MIGANGSANGRGPARRTTQRGDQQEQLDKLLIEGDPEAAGMVHSAIEEFAQEFAAVIRRFLRLKEWKDVERIVVGGGLRQSRIGELAIGRTSVALKARGHAVDLHRFVMHPITQGSLAASISSLRGSSPAMTASLRSTSAAATSARVSSSSTPRRSGICRMPTSIAWSSGGTARTRPSATMQWNGSSSS